MSEELPEQNLDRLSDDAKAIISHAFRRVMCGWTLTYMIEVRLDDPVLHLFNGGEGFLMHGGNGSPHYARHLGADDWAVIHCDSEAWRTIDTDELADRGQEIVRGMCTTPVDD